MPSGMCTTGRLPFCAAALLITAWMVAASAPAGTSKIWRWRLGSTPGSVGSVVLMVLGLTTVVSISAILLHGAASGFHAQSWFWIAFGTVKVLPSATTLSPSTTGPLVTPGSDLIVLS